MRMIWVGLAVRSLGEVSNVDIENDASSTS